MVPDGVWSRGYSPEGGTVPGVQFQGHVPGTTNPTEQIHRHPWKHYLPATSFAGGNYRNNEVYPVVDPGFPRQGCPPLGFQQKPIIWRDLCWKLRKNERNWTGGGTSLVPPPLASAVARTRTHTHAHTYRTHTYMHTKNTHRHLLGNGILSHCRIFEGPRPILMIHDTEFLKQVFAKKGANFMDRRVSTTHDKNMFLGIYISEPFS